MSDQIDAIRASRFTVLAVCFELSLGALAVVFGWLTGPWPWESLFPSPRTGHVAAILMGGAVALPLFAGIVLVERKPLPWLADLQRIVRHHVVPLFRQSSVGGLLLISLAAGLGEELLFRGYCQAALTDWWGPGSGTWLAVLTASVLFGICHWLCRAYALLATFMGLVLGMLFLVTGNLLAPIVTHALYDFLALLYLVHQDKGDGQGASPGRA